MADLKNREVFLRDPLTTTIPNDGVTKVGQPQSDRDWATLRYELESFVCDGEYQRGLERILSAFLTNLSRPQQQAVWVSGFYGSGKSHLVRVLEYLWRDVEFPDGARARSLVTLPTDIQAHFTELARLGKQEGGLWSAAGTLGAGTGTVRLSLLAILFRSAKLPEQYPAARLVMWLKQTGQYEAVRTAVESRGRSLASELRNMYVSPALAESILETVPELARDRAQVHALLREQYPNVTDIPDGEFLATMNEVLAMQSTTPGKLPLTLLIFDELQQFIGNDPERTLHVQNVVEACSARFGGNLLFVGTGQSALEANPELQKLQGRFSVRVTLSDADVEKVVREVVLRKAPDKVADVKRVLDASSGEIDRHLAGTRIGPQAEDVQDRVADYPILPVRRRLWERMLRAVDTAGAAGQLRTQLRIVHDTVRDVAQESLGIVAPADAMYWQIEAEMLQSGVLQRDLATVIRQLDNGTEEGRLRSRLCSLIFMINQLHTEGPLATGVRATTNALADLVVDDLTEGSATLRQQIPIVLQSLVDDGTLILVGDEYRLQTKESAEWEQDFRARYARIRADDARIASDRGTVIREAVATTLRGLTFFQGASRVSRKFELYFGAEAPPTATADVPVWVQDEWSTAQRVVRDAALQAGTASPVVFVSLPRQEADALREAIARAGAADETVKTRPVPQTGGGTEARAAMASRAETEQRHVRSLVDNILKNATVYQGGGNEVVADTFPQAVKQAVDAALERLFTKFGAVDQPGWDKVVVRARDGAANPLSALGYTLDVEKHPACQEVRAFVGPSGKRGSEVRRHFTEPPYGWPRDAVDGALLALLAGGFLRASANGQAVAARGMTQQQIGVTDFFAEGVTVTALHRIAIRKLGSGLGLPIKNGEEVQAVPAILARLEEEARAAGGDPPLPERPDGTLIHELKGMAGNQQVAAVADRAEELLAYHKAWSAAEAAARQRLPDWERLRTFLHHARDLPVADELKPHVEAILANRNLLDEPNPVQLLLSQVTSALRKAVSEAHGRLAAERDQQVADLEASEAWELLKPEDKKQLLEANGLGAIPDLDVGTDQGLMDCLNDATLKEWNDRVFALKARAAQAREQAARILAPKAVTVRPPSATLNTREDVESYIESLRKRLLADIDEHPVFIP